MGEKEQNILFKSFVVVVAIVSGLLLLAKLLIHGNGCNVPPPYKSIVVDSLRKNLRDKYVDTNGIVYSRDTSVLEYVYDSLKDDLLKCEIPNGVKIIDDGAFYYCRNLRNVIILPSVKEIRNFAFSFCPNLQHINLPKSIEFIGYNPFCDTVSKTIEINNKKFYMKGNCLIDRTTGTLLSYTGQEYI